MTAPQGSIGIVSFDGLIGDHIRTSAIRSFVRDQHIPFENLQLVHGRPSVNGLSQVLWPGGAKYLLRKVFGDNDSVSLMTELNWHVEVKRWEGTAAASVDALERQLGGVSVLHAEGLLSALACARLKARRGTPYVYDMHGLMAEEAKFVGSHEWANACVQWEREAVIQADRVIVVTEPIRDYVNREYGVSADRIVMCPNGAAMRDVQPSFSTPLKVVYAGTFAKYENVPTFAKTAAIKSGPDFTFVLIGDGAERNKIFDYINANFVDIVYLGRKKHTRTMELLGEMHVGFMAQPGDTPMTGSPIKLLDYAACGLPVIAGPGLWEKPIRVYDCGVIIEDLSPEAFARGLDVFRDRAVWERMSRNAKTMVREAYQWDEMLRPLAQLYAGGVLAPIR